MVLEMCNIDVPIAFSLQKMRHVYQISENTDIICYTFRLRALDYTFEMRTTFEDTSNTIYRG